MTPVKRSLAAAAVAIALPLAARHWSTTGSTPAARPAARDLSQKAGQLMMVGFRGHELTSETRQSLRDLHPGGVCLYAQNITGAEQVGRLNDELRFCLDELLPPFLAVDQEGGVVVRINDGVTVFPSMMAVGATRSPRLAFAAGKALGSELRLLGFNMNLAPVLDTPQNLAIGSRSFSDDPRLIAQLGTAFICGQQEAGIATVAKHFPGQGRSSGDSHYTLPVRWESAPSIRSELDPFCDAIGHDLDAVMTAHVAIPAIDKTRRPATISPKLLTGVLRRELNFDGLILTDELEGMRAISTYGVEQAAVAAINAGADMVFVAFSPETQTRVHCALMDAIRSGRIPQARLDQALAHIVTLKTKRKLFDSMPPLEERLAALRRSEGRTVAAEIAQQSITRFEPGAEFVPMNAASRVALVTDSDNFVRAIRARAPQTKVLMIDGKALRDAAATKRAIHDLQGAADTIIGAFISYKNLQILHSVSMSRPLVIVFMNVPAPDFLRGIPEPQAVLINYSYQPLSAEAVADVLFEHSLTPGILPVQAEPARSAARTVNAR